jgi:hypothetical protein
MYLAFVPISIGILLESSQRKAKPYYQRNSFVQRWLSLPNVED